ncbi:MAG: MBG domain-containing protein, partial [Bacteroidales bacterium]
PDNELTGSQWRKADAGSELPGRHEVLSDNLRVILSGKPDAVPNYNLIIRSSWLDITNPDATPIRIIAKDARKTYGNLVDPAFEWEVDPPTVDISGFDIRLVRLDKRQTVAEGPYPITLDYYDLGPDYKLVEFTPGLLYIDPVPIRLVARDDSKEYGDPDPDFVIEALPPLLFEGERLTGTPLRERGEEVVGSPYAIWINDVDPGTNYVVTDTLPGELTIRPKGLQIRALDDSKIYGDPDPDPFGWEVISPAGFDLSKVTLMLARDPGEDVEGGPYHIFLKSINLNPNYYLDKAYPGLFEILPRNVELVARDASKTYGDPDPPLTEVEFIPPLVSGDQISFTLKRVPGETVAGSPYPIDFESVTPDPNYQVVGTTPGNFYIIPAGLIIIPRDTFKITGEPNPYPIEFDFEGLRNGETSTAAPPEFETDADLTSPPGDYRIFISRQASDSNYDIQYQEAVLTVLPERITPVIHWSDPADIIYGTLLIEQLGNYGIPNPLFQLNAYATEPAGQLVLGTMVYDPPEGTLLDVGAGQELKANFTPDNLRIYNLPDPKSVHINVTPKELQVYFIAADKDYDGTTDATITEAYLTGVLDRDDGQVWVVSSSATAHFDTPDQGIGKPVTGTGFELAGPAAYKYYLVENQITNASIYPITRSSSVTVNQDKFNYLREEVILTARIEDGGPIIAGRPQAAESVTFMVDGLIIRDRSGGHNIALTVDPGTNDLVATVSFTLYEITSTGTVAPGNKEVKAFFNDINQNYQVLPNPAETEFRFSPGFEVLVYPNPSPGYINFKVTVDMKSLVVIDLLTETGQFLHQVFEGVIPDETTILLPYNGYLSQLAQGVYIYRATNGLEWRNGKIVILQIYR